MEIEPTSEMPLDSGIRDAVLVLRAAGIETFESCEGGEGHPFAEPTVRFHGSRSEGYKAFTIAADAGLSFTCYLRNIQHGTQRRISQRASEESGEISVRLLVRRSAGPAQA